MPFIQILPNRGVATVGEAGDIRDVSADAAASLVRDGYARRLSDGEAKRLQAKAEAAAIEALAGVG